MDIDNLYIWLDLFKKLNFPPFVTFIKSDRICPTQYWIFLGALCTLCQPYTFFHPLPPLTFMYPFSNSDLLVPFSWHLCFSQCLNWHWLVPYVEGKQRMYEKSSFSKFNFKHVNEIVSSFKFYILCKSVTLQECLKVKKREAILGSALAFNSITS